MTGGRGARNGAAVRALASLRCSPGSSSGVDAISGLSLLLVLSFAPRGFSGYSSLSLSSKTNISQFQFDKESSRRRTILWMCYLQIIILFIYYFFNDAITELAKNNVPKTSIFERFWSYLALDCKGCLKRKKKRKNKQNLNSAAC